MAIRKIVKIDEEKCNGCGECAPSCAEGAIKIIDGKAKLVSEVYCDGLGACLGTCPMDAITIEEREAKEFDEKKTMEYLKKVEKEEKEKSSPQSQGCPGSKMMDFTGGCPSTKGMNIASKNKDNKNENGCNSCNSQEVASQLGNWPLQLHLVPVDAPYFKNSDLIIAADCVGFALPQFNERHIRQNPVVIACPKLDNTEPYVEKLAAIFKNNSLNSVTVYHMEVPCCTGIVRIAIDALQRSGAEIEFKDVTVGIRGEIK